MHLCSVRFLWLIALLLGSGGAIADDRQEKLSAILYPATKSWRLVSDAPKVPPELFRSIRETLRAAYFSPKMKKEFLEGADCSFIGRALEPSDTSPFHLMDFDGDGRQDVVYAGDAHCAEGEVTLIWFGVPEGYVVRQSVLWHLRVLRVSPSAETMSSVAVGCCGDPVDQFHLGNLRNLRQYSRIRVTQDTTLPRALLPSALAFHNRSEMKLRETPQEINSYDRGRSEFMAHAVFGNVLRKYLPGASGVVLATETRKGKCWGFVVVNRDDERLMLEAPYDIDAGWAAGACFPSSPPRAQ
jgi:hypothetical protein